MNLDKKTIIILSSVGIVVFLVIGFLAYSILFNSLSKPLKQIKVHNWDIAIAQLKEIIYDDENNNKAKGLLVYASLRKQFEEEGVRSFNDVFSALIDDANTLRILYFYNELNKKNLLIGADKIEFFEESKKIRKELLDYYNINTESFDDVVEMVESISKLGIQYFDLAKGDEVDRGIYAFLLAGNSFFGDNRSNEELVKLSHSYRKAAKLFRFCNEDMQDLMIKERYNVGYLIPDYSFFLFPLLKSELEPIFRKNDRFESAIKNVEKTNFYFKPQYQINGIFFNHFLFDTYVYMLKKDINNGVDVNFYEVGNHIFVVIYGYIPKMKQYVTMAYVLNGDKLNKITFNNNLGETVNIYTKNEPIDIRFRLNDTRNNIVIELKKYVKTIENEVRPEIVYNPYLGSYQYRENSYQVERIKPDIKTYTLVGNTAMLYN